MKNLLGVFNFLLLLAVYLPQTVNAQVNSQKDEKYWQDLMDLANRGDALIDIGDYNAAINVFTQVINKEPNLMWRAYLERGFAYLKIDAFDSAIADFTRIIQLRPADASNMHMADAFGYRGDAYLSKREYDQAIADLNEAIRLSPGYVNAIWNRGVAFYAKGEYSRAITDLELVLRLMPDHPQARQFLDRARQRAGR